MSSFARHLKNEIPRVARDDINYAYRKKITTESAAAEP